MLRVIPADDRAVVRGVNVAKKHQKQTASEQGGIVAKELTILGTVINPSTHHRAVELLPTLGLERLGILTFPLAQYEEAFRAQHERRAGKVQLAPQAG